MSPPVCSECFKALLRKKGDLHWETKGVSFVIHDATWQECTSCGEKVFPSKIAQRIADAYHAKCCPPFATTGICDSESEIFCPRMSQGNEPR